MKTGNTTVNGIPGVVNSQGVFTPNTNYGVGKVPYHIHNGTDSARVSAGSLLGTLIQLHESQGSLSGANFATSHTMYVNDNVSGNYVVKQVTVVYAAGSTGTLQVEVANGKIAMGSGATQLAVVLPFSQGTNVANYGTLIGSPTTILGGGKVNLLYAGSFTGLANAGVTVTLQKVS